jgi:hypothetical protein
MQAWERLGYIDSFPRLGHQLGCMHNHYCEQNVAMVQSTYDVTREILRGLLFNLHQHAEALITSTLQVL